MLSQSRRSIKILIDKKYTSPNILLSGSNMLLAKVISKENTFNEQFHFQFSNLPCHNSRQIAFSKSTKFANYSLKRVLSIKLTMNCFNEGFSDEESLAATHNEIPKVYLNFPKAHLEPFAGSESAT